MVFTQSHTDATPLTPEEAAALIPAFIATRADLNIAEQRNILAAESWAFRRSRDVLTESFLRQLHHKMFNQVWKWAGAYRSSARNIGLDAWRIGSAISELLNNTQYWQTEEVYSVDEIAARFHHQLVWIHPFPNGNGRHARLAADLLLVENQRPRFSWGFNNLQEPGETRQRYITALKAADDHDIKPLLDFVRS